MKTRILTSIGIVITILLMFLLKVYISPYFFDALFLTIALFAAYEMSKLLSRMNKPNNLYIGVVYAPIAFVITLLCMFFKLNFGYILLIDIAIMLPFAFVAFIWSLIDKKSTQNEMKIRNVKSKMPTFCFKKALTTMITFVYPTLLFLAMSFLNHFDEISIESVSSFGGKLSLVIIIFAFLIPMLTDTFAMLSGMLFGGKKIAQKISPNKTISGTIGGTLFCVLLGTCVYLILGSIDYFQEVVNNLEIWKVIIVLVLGSAIDQLGDLLESFIKRKASVKDSGSVLPGHGGMLDRIDSYLLVAPMLLLAFVIILLL